MVIFTVVLTVISVVLRNPIASAVGVKHDPWAAAIGIPAGCLWLELSILRGALQGVGDYKSRRPQPDLRAGEPARRPAPCLRDRPRRHRRVSRHAAVVHRDVRVLRAPAAPPRRADDRDEGRAGQGPCRGDRAVDPRPPRLGADRRPDRDRRAPEHRHHRREAPPAGQGTASSYAATAVAAKVLIWVAIGAELLSRAGGLAPAARRARRPVRCCSARSGSSSSARSRCC